VTHGVPGARAGAKPRRGPGRAPSIVITLGVTITRCGPELMKMTEIDRKSKKCLALARKWADTRASEALDADLQVSGWRIFTPTRRHAAVFVADRKAGAVRCAAGMNCPVAGALPRRMADPRWGTRGGRTGTRADAARRRDRRAARQRRTASLPHARGPAGRPRRARLRRRTARCRCRTRTTASVPGARPR